MTNDRIEFFEVLVEDYEYTATACQTTDEATAEKLRAAIYEYLKARDRHQIYKSDRVKIRKTYLIGATSEMFTWQAHWYEEGYQKTECDVDVEEIEPTYDVRWPECFLPENNHCWLRGEFPNHLCAYGTSREDAQERVKLLHERFLQLEKEKQQNG